MYWKEFYWEVRMASIWEQILNAIVTNKSERREYLSCLNLLFIISGLIDEIREDIGILTLLAEVLCLLDMIVNSFAHTISTKPVDRYTRPEFTGEGLAPSHAFICNAYVDSLVCNVFGFQLSLFMTSLCR